MKIRQWGQQRLPALLSLSLCMIFCACLAYWMMQLVRPPLRPIAAPAQLEQAQIDPGVAATLFGGGGAVVVANNYQLFGVVAAHGDSVAILSTDGKPAQAVRQGKELLPGTSVKEVHASYVLLSEGGILKRVMLPEDTPTGLVKHAVSAAASLVTLPEEAER